MTRTASGSSATSSWQNSRNVAPSTVLQRLVGGGGEAAVLGQPAHEGGRQRARDPGGRVDLGAVVEHQHRQGRVVLGRRATRRGLEPRARRVVTTTATTGGADASTGLVGVTRPRRARSASDSASGIDGSASAIGSTSIGSSPLVASSGPARSRSIAISSEPLVDSGGSIGLHAADRALARGSSCTRVTSACI